MSTKKPLEGLRIIDYTMWIAAPAGPYMLADMGAEVIKIEEMIGNGDPYRRIGASQGAPIKGEDGKDMNPWFDTVNYNKQWMCLNTKTREGRQILIDLLGTADAFVTSLRQDVLERRGLDYDTIHEIYPKLPYIHFLGYGEKGPLKDKAAFDMTTYFAGSGIWTASVPEGTPFLGNFPTAFADCWSGGYVASAIQTGILESMLHGTGDYLTLGLYGEAFWSQRLDLIECQFGKQFPRDPRNPNSPLIASYKTKDGRWMELCISDYDRYYAPLIKGLGREDLVNNPDYSTQTALYATPGKKEELTEIIRECFANMTAAEVHSSIDPADIPCEECQTYEDMLKSEQAFANEYLVKVEYPTGDTSLAMPQPVSSRNAGSHMLNRSKVPGADNEKYLLELGYSKEQIENLRASGSIK